MNRNKNEFLEYEVYDNVVNIDLFNNIVNFIIFTTPIEKNDLLYTLEEKHIWFKRKFNYNIPFKYFGELLERYQEKIGTDIKDIRAIALALAYTIDIVTEQMIVGNQLVNFIRDIEKMAVNDIYLKAALYICDNQKYYNYFNELKESKYNKTEDLIFVLSIFDDFKEGFDIFKDQLKELIGNKKTIEVFNNIGIFKWLIKRLYPIINKSRARDVELFKCLINVPTALIKENSKIYNLLMENNYSKEEIAFLNYSIIKYRPVPNTVRTRKSIVEEKIALNMCEVMLNSEMTHSNNIYAYIKDTLSHYNTFEIKCYGFERIIDALENTVNIKNPKTFIELYRIFKNKIFSFDILDDKWDIVSKEFESKDYRDLFDNYLLFNDFNKEKIMQAIEKYNQLTNSSYLNSFGKEYYYRDGIYSKLVESDVIDLKNEYLEYINSNEKKRDIEHLKNYVRKIRNRKSFLFLKYFLQEHTVEETDKMGFDFKYLYNLSGNYYYYYQDRIDIKREFLSTEENKQLFYWINEYVFKNEPKSYIEFIVYVLKDKYLTSVFSKEELREIYLTIIKMDEQIFNDGVLREKYLTKQELEEEKRKEKEAQEQEEKIKLQEKENKIITEFNDIKEYTFKKIFDFYDRCTWDDKGQEIKSKLIVNYLKSNIQKQEVNNSELIYLNKICHMLLIYNVIDIDIYKEYIIKYLNEGRREVCKVL